MEEVNDEEAENQCRQTSEESLQCSEVMVIKDAAVQAGVNIDRWRSTNSEILVNQWKKELKQCVFSCKQIMGNNVLHWSTKLCCLCSFIFVLSPFISPSQCRG